MAAPMDELEKMGPLGKIDYVFCVCEKHQREHCHACFFDFRHPNELALEEATAEELLLCRANGCKSKAVKSCPSCFNVKYCCQDCGNLDWKARHKDECTRAKGSLKSTRTGAPVKRINLSCGNMDDTLVDIFPVNTRLIMHSRNPNRPEPLRGKVVSFNTGRGIYADPEVKYDPKHGLNDDDMCTYAIKYEDGEVSIMNCVDVHSDFVLDESKKSTTTYSMVNTTAPAIVPPPPSPVVVSKDEKVCAECLQVLPKSSFSGAQAKKKTTGACKECVEERLLLAAGAGEEKKM